MAPLRDRLPPTPNDGAYIVVVMLSLESSALFVPLSAAWLRHGVERRIRRRPARSLTSRP